MERIPQVKPVRRRKANRRALVFLALFFLSLATFLFVRSPYSKIHAVHVTGTHLLSPGEVIRQSGLVPGHTLILFSADRVRERLARLPEVKETAVAWRWPNEVEIAVTERAVLAYVVQNGQHVPLLEGGVLLFHRAGKGPYVDLPLVTRWEEPRRLPQLAAGLTKLPAAVRERLSEIQLVPTAAYPDRVRLYTREGFVVYTSLAHLADKLAALPQLLDDRLRENPQERGAFYLFDAMWYEGTAKATDE